MIQARSNWIPRVFASLCLLFSFSAAHGEAWPVERSWTAAEERLFSSWVRAIGGKARSSINRFIRDKEHNHLYDKADEDLWLSADCADFPIMLRAYYAYKRGLPFAYTVVSGGRYTREGNQTSAIYDNLSFEGTAAEFLKRIPAAVHSGVYRTVPETTDSMTYPVAIHASTLRPGVVFYSPEGHVGIIAEVTSDGNIYLLDAHPDQTVSRIRFSAKLIWKSTARVGGFRMFRPVEVKDGEVRLVTDFKKLPGYSVEQYALRDYYGTIQNRLARQQVDPIWGFEKYVREDVYAEVLDRVRSVELGWAIGKEEEISVPSNIYSAEGDWENYSSPSRDLRLRRAFHHTVSEVATCLRLAREDPGRFAGEWGGRTGAKKLGQKLLREKERLFSELEFSYQNSEGKPVRLTLADVEKRLYRLSFDPNHPPELRWGASGRELETAPRNQWRYHGNYEDQQRWRNRTEKKHGSMGMKDEDNPESPPPHDLSAQIRDLIQSPSL